MLTSAASRNYDSSIVMAMRNIDEYFEYKDGSSIIDDIFKIAALYS